MAICLQLLCLVAPTRLTTLCTLPHLVALFTNLCLPQPVSMEVSVNVNTEARVERRLCHMWVLGIEQGPQEEQHFVLTTEHLSCLPHTPPPI